MGLFESIFKSNYNVDNTELASQLFDTQIVGSNVDRKYQKQIFKILKDCTSNGSKYPERQQVLLKIIDLIGEPKTSKERFIVAKAYAWSRSNYNDKAIKYLELYLSNDLYSEAMNKSYSLKERTKYHLSEMYGYLAKAYIKNYDFEKALSVYQFLIDKYPDDVPSYMGKCETLIKLNHLEECHSWLLNCKKSKYYIFNEKFPETSTENWFYFTINRLLEDVENKIKKGYKYRPRKTKK